MAGDRAAEAPRYLPSIRQRSDASDFVCTALASAPVRTGVTRTINGGDRDQLSSKVKFETCFKGKPPVSSPFRVVGYSVIASKDIHEGYIYSGPPPGFLRKGRDLLFLRETADLVVDIRCSSPASQPVLHNLVLSILHARVAQGDRGPLLDGNSTGRSCWRCISVAPDARL
jgi:hypothetical protein